MQAKTIIIGGGMAGMSCAMKLLDAGADFLLITDDLGGRIKYSQQAKINFGAYFVMSKYVNAKKLVSKGLWINPLDSCFHNSETERFIALSLHTLTRLPDCSVFTWRCGNFRRTMNLLNRAASPSHKKMR